MFIENNVETIFNSFRTAFFEKFAMPLEIGTDEFAVASVFSYVISILFNAANQADKNRFIDTMDGQHLDLLAANYGIGKRPDGKKATVILAMIINDDYPETRFDVGEIVVRSAKGFEYTNKNPMVLVGNRRPLLNLEFEATKIGQAPGDGPLGRLVLVSPETQDSNVFYQSTLIKGQKSYESDDDFRTYLKDYIGSMAQCGTALAYESKSRLADERVIDSYCIRQSDPDYVKGKAQVVLLPSRRVPQGEYTSLISDVEAALKADDFRPIGDFVQCSISPAQIYLPFNVNFSLHVVYSTKNISFGELHYLAVMNKYLAEIGQKINAPFCMAEVCKRLLEEIEEYPGVKAIEAAPVGLTQDEIKKITLPGYNHGNSNMYHWEIAVEDIPRNLYAQ